MQEQLTQQQDVKIQATIIYIFTSILTQGLNDIFGIFTAVNIKSFIFKDIKQCSS
jgi:hypothetical protein